MKKQILKAVMLVFVLVLAVIACIIPMSAEEYKTGDMNGDDQVNSDDAIYLLRHTLSPEKYPLSCNHSLISYDAKAATCSNVGNIPYWHCTRCDKYFADQNSESIISLADTVIDIDETVHQYSTEWSSDETHHWHSANCLHTSYKKDYAEHDWDEGTYTQESETGKSIKLFTCKGCGRTKTEYIQYTVTFVDFDGRVLKTETVESGKSATPPANPTRDGYVFIGWDKAYDCIVEDIKVTAMYTKVSVPTIVVGNVTGRAGDEVTVTFDMSGSPKLYAMSLKVTYDDTALTLLASSESGDAMSDFTYTKPSRFKSGANFMWYANDPAVANGTVLKLVFKINDVATAGNYPITMTCDPSNTYDENDNDINIAFVNGSVTVEAAVSVTTYTVTFVDYNGTVLKTETVESGKTATAPAAPEREGYIFTGWDKDFDNITDNITVMAAYTKISDPTIMIGSASGFAGDQVIINVDLANSPKLYAMSLKIAYDETSLTLLSSSESGEAMGDFTYTKPSRFKSGANFMWYANDPAIANGTVLKLVFGINEGASAGNYPITMTCDPSNTYDEDDNDVNFAFVSGTVTVK